MHIANYIYNCLGYKRAIITALIGAVIAVSDLLIVTFIAYYVSSVIDSYPSYFQNFKESLEYLIPGILAELTLFSFIFALAISRIWLTKYLINSAFHQCNKLFAIDIKSTFNQPLINFQKKELSEHIDEYTNRYNLIYFNIMISMYLFLANVALLIIYALFALIINITLASMITLIIFIIGLITLKVMHSSTDADAKIIDSSLLVFTSALTNALRSIVSLKVSNAIPNVVTKIVQHQDDLRMAQSRNFTRTITSKYILEILLLLILFTLVVISNVYELSVDTVQLAIILMIGLKSLPVIQTVNSTLVNFKGNIQAVDAILDRSTAILAKPSIESQRYNIKQFKSLSAEDVSFAYPDGDELYHKFNFHITAGEHILFTGKSGSGKSTLLNILLGLLQPNSGTVKLNSDTDITKVNVANIFQYVPQTVYLENLDFQTMFSKTKLEKNELRVHFEKLELQEIFEKYYESKIGDNGERLSGGERQRVALIKSVLAGPEVLFLDEATSALNMQLECKALNYIFEHSTTIICVSHSIHVSNLFKEKGGKVIG